MYIYIYIYISALAELLKMKIHVVKKSRLSTVLKFPRGRKDKHIKIKLTEVPNVAQQKGDKIKCFNSVILVSASCCAASMDIPDPLSLLLIVHCL